MPTLTPFAKVALLLVMAAGIGLIGTLARRPLIVSFIAVGLIAGPSALDVVRSDARIDLLSDLGIAVLLFLVAIKLDVTLIRSLGVVSVMTGLGLEADFGDASDPERIAEPPFRGAEWMVSTVPIHPTSLSQEDTRRPLIQLARSAGFTGQITAASHSSGDSEVLFGAGVDLALEPFQDAADRAEDLLSGAATQDRTDFPDIAAEDRAKAQREDFNPTPKGRLP